MGHDASSQLPRCTLWQRVAYMFALGTWGFVLVAALIGVVVHPLAVHA